MQETGDIVANVTIFFHETNFQFHEIMKIIFTVRHVRDLAPDHKLK